MDLLAVFRTAKPFKQLVIGKIECSEFVCGAGFSSAQYNNLSAALASLEKRALVETYTAWVPNQWHSSHRDALPAVRLMSEALKPHRWPTFDEARSTNA